MQTLISFITSPAGAAIFIPTIAILIGVFSKSLLSESNDKEKRLHWLVGTEAALSSVVILVSTILEKIRISGPSGQLSVEQQKFLITLILLVLFCMFLYLWSMSSQKSCLRRARNRTIQYYDIAWTNTPGLMALVLTSFAIAIGV